MELQEAQQKNHEKKQESLLGDFERIYPIVIDTENMTCEKVVKLQKMKVLYE